MGLKQQPSVLDEETESSLRKPATSEGKLLGVVVGGAVGILASRLLGVTPRVGITVGGLIGANAERIGPKLFKGQGHDLQIDESAKLSESRRQALLDELAFAREGHVPQSLQDLLDDYLTLDDETEAAPAPYPEPTDSKEEAVPTAAAPVPEVEAKAVPTPAVPELDKPVAPMAKAPETKTPTKAPDNESTYEPKPDAEKALHFFDKEQTQTAPTRLEDLPIAPPLSLGKKPMAMSASPKTVTKEMPSLRAAPPLFSPKPTAPPPPPAASAPSAEKLKAPTEPNQPTEPNLPAENPPAEKAPDEPSTESQASPDLRSPLAQSLWSRPPAVEESADDKQEAELADRQGLSAAGVPDFGSAKGGAATTNRPAAGNITPEPATAATAGSAPMAPAAGAKSPAPAHNPPASAQETADAAVPAAEHLFRPAQRPSATHQTPAAAPMPLARRAPKEPCPPQPAPMAPPTGPLFNPTQSSTPKKPVVHSGKPPALIPSPPTAPKSPGPPPPAATPEITPSPAGAPPAQAPSQLAKPAIFATSDSPEAPAPQSTKQFSIPNLPTLPKSDQGTTPAADPALSRLFKPAPTPGSGVALEPPRTASERPKTPSSAAPAPSLFTPAPGQSKDTKSTDKSETLVTAPKTPQKTPAQTADLSKGEATPLLPKSAPSLKSDSAPPLLKKESTKKAAADAKPQSEAKPSGKEAKPSMGRKVKGDKAKAGDAKVAASSQTATAKESVDEVVPSKGGLSKSSKYKRKKKTKKGKGGFWLFLSFLLVGGGLAVAAVLLEDQISGFFLSLRNGGENSLPLKPELQVKPPPPDAAPVGAPVPPPPVVIDDPTPEGAETNPIEEDPKLPDGAAIEILPAESFFVEEGGDPTPPSTDIIEIESSILDDLASSSSYDPIVREFETARSAVVSLLEATSVSEALQVVHEPLRTEELMSFYLGSKPIDPTDAKKIDLVNAGTVPGTELNAYLMKVITSDHPDGFPVLIEQTADGYKIDWDAYVQCKDRLLEKFFAAQSGTSEAFYVTLKRAHFGDDDVVLARKLCFEVSSPLPTDPSQFVYADANSKLGQELEARIQWNKVYFPVLKLQWEPADGKHTGYMRIDEFVRDTWRKKRTAE